ncbi:hypothetical protein Tco_1291746 [Tanacetum coccineum]
MNQQETQQVIACDEKWVPSTERVKISSTNLRLETTVPQKEETFQVVIDVIKNFTCFKVFTISANVPEIFMQQFWYTIKKVQGTDSYEFLLANKKCRVDAEVFRKILDIYPRVEGEEFIELQNNDDTLTFLIDLGHKGEDYQEYRLAIPDVMLNDAIKQSESYHMIIKYSTSQIPPKKNRGKGSQGKKIVDDSHETVDVSKESEPEPVKKKTASRRVIKKKVIISSDDNIIPDLDVALELGKSISLAEAEEEEEVAKQVHATHARIVTESAKKNSVSGSSRSVVIQDTPSAPKSKPSISKPKLKGVQSLTPEEQETAELCKLLKKSTVIYATSSEGTCTKPGVPDEEKVSIEEKVILEWRSEQESEYSKEDLNEEEDIDWINSEEDVEKKDDIDDDKSIDLETTDDEETDDELLQGKEQANDEEDEAMLNDEVEVLHPDNGRNSRMQHNDQS